MDKNENDYCVLSVAGIQAVGFTPSAGCMGTQSMETWTVGISIASERAVGTMIHTTTGFSLTILSRRRWTAQHWPFWIYIDHFYFNFPLLMWDVGNGKLGGGWVGSAGPQKVRLRFLSPANWLYVTKLLAAQPNSKLLFPAFCFPSIR